MDPLELIARANHVRELVEHPGWAFVKELIDDQVEAARKVVPVDPRLAATHVAADPLKVAVKWADAGGQMRGLETLASTVATIVELADSVQAKIEAEED